VIDEWIAALEKRHLAQLTRAEVTRALRALSSCYVERRDKLAGGAALEGAGKRAAFALFYGPLHFVTISQIVRASDLSTVDLDVVLDLGCGTGVGGAAWALAAARPPDVLGFDRSAWAVDEANWTYRQLGVRGRAHRADIGSEKADIQSRKHAPSKTAILLGYAVNELSDDARQRLLASISAMTARGSKLLVVEPVATRLGLSRWWEDWKTALAPHGALENEWRFPADLPPLVAEVARGAGLRPRELTARTLTVAGR
jgi:hypothetical protein